MKKLFCITGVLLLTGCTTVATQHRPNDYYAVNKVSSVSQSEPMLDLSSETLTEKSINDILNYQVILPKTSRIAILKMSTDNYGFGDNVTQLNESVVGDFVDVLRGSPRVYDASFLPAMLIPPSRSFVHLRTAAARVQADLLLVYRSSCNVYHQYNMLNPNVGKARCTIEAMLLDVRSGIVPFTVVSSNDYSLVQAKDDLNHVETKQRAQLSAVASALKEVALKLTAFLNRQGD